MNAAVPVPAVATPPLAPLPPGWDGDRLLELAREIAMNINDEAVILQNSGLTQQQYDDIKKIPFFARAVEAMRVDWESAGNTNKRLAIKAATALEATLPKLTGRLADKEESLDGVVKGATLLAKIAGIDEKKQGESGADKFSITINLGADEKLRIEKDITPGAVEKTEVPAVLRQVLEGAANEAALRPVPEANRNAGPIQQIAEGPGTPAPVVALPEGARSNSSTEA